MLECTGVALVALEGDNSDKKWELKLKQALDEQLQVPRRKQFTVKPRTPGFSQSKHRKKIAGSPTRKGTTRECQRRLHVLGDACPYLH